MYLRTTKTMDISSIRNRDLPAGCVWMSKAVMDNVMFTHPEDRNIQNTVFGGFIMRQATELSAILGYKYSRQRPILKSISDINFQKPISIGSLLQMHAYVVFTEENYLQFIVIATAYDTKTFITQQTNTFHITYRTAEKVPEVIPSTYHQTMMFVDGRRHFLGALKKESMHQEK
ncbi:hypothetical protein NQ317_012671 [Molorchus minor]|uniref:HotDog ACOT-type domain-containing protein n=1 Tax=Molorchus minor TaxID=1323400 RepID=A0ABQ9IWN6_9CUCU|nr:hypothetical protein NQ317_012671 [Molorchus minor]